MSAQCKSSAGPGDSPASSRAGRNVIDGIEYTSAEIERLLGDLLGRSMLEPRGLDDGTTLLKVLAYVTRPRNGDVELLVFDHRDAPEAGIQVPAGTIEPGESPDVAAVRELREETGLANARPLGRIDVYEWEHPDTYCWHRRHVYQFEASPDTPDSWEHVVSAGDDDRGMTFVCRWLPLGVAEDALCADQGASIQRIVPLDR